MKKVGIITQWTAQHNYGQKLQAYSLEEYLKKNGLKPYLIKYRWDSIWWYPVLFYRYLSTFVIYLFGLITNKKNWAFRKFDYFSNKYLNITRILPNFRELTKYCQDFSLLITGSDQVWRKDMYYDKNKRVHYDAMDAFTLSIPCQAKKISYAASAGHFFPPAELENEFISRIKKLDAVSVRERNLSDYLSAHGVKSTIVPDPVFLLNKEEYVKFAGQPFNNPKFKRNCFFYSLDWDSYISVEEISTFLHNKYGKNYTHVSGFNGKAKLPQTDFPTIQEWIAYIGNADLIITNSFHCVAFSIIFNKDFYYVPLLPEENKTDDRITTLLDYLELNNREIKSIKELENKISSNELPNWVETNMRLNAFSQIGKEYLDNILSIMKTE